MEHNRSSLSRETEVVPLCGQLAVDMTVVGCGKVLTLGFCVFFASNKITRHVTIHVMLPTYLVLLTRTVHAPIST